MNKIPTHTVHNQFEGQMAMIKYVSYESFAHKIDYAHRDNYYMFFFLEEGAVRLMIDFKEYYFEGSSIYCLLPGQVHLPVDTFTIKAWAMAVDSTLVKKEYKEIFERVSLLDSNIVLGENRKQELHACASLIQQRLTPDMEPLEQLVLYDLISFYIGMVAEIYQKGFPVLAGNRLSTITFEFKSLLSAHYQTLKRPSQYASLLHISPVYLNEAVKKTTGLTVSDCIRNEIIVQAKRLLFYTDMSIKEVANELGYDDWAYFTRLFTKMSGVSPTQFRKSYLK